MTDPETSDSEIIDGWYDAAPEPDEHSDRERWLEDQRWTLFEEDGVYKLNLISPTFGGGGTVVRLVIVR